MLYELKRLEEDRKHLLFFEDEVEVEDEVDSKVRK